MFCSLAPFASGPCVILTFAAPDIVPDCDPSVCYRLSTKLFTCVAVFLDFITDAKFTVYIFAITDALDCILNLWKPIFFIGQGLIENAIDGQCVHISDVPNILLLWTNSIITCFDNLISVLTGGAVTSFFEFLFQFLLAIAYEVVNGVELTITCMQSPQLSSCFANYPSGTEEGRCVLNSQGQAIGGLQNCISILNACLIPIPLYAPLVNVPPPTIFELVQDLFASLDLVVCAATSVIGCFTGITCDPNHDFPGCITAIDSQLQCVANTVPPLNGFMSVLVDVLNGIVVIATAGADAIQQINQALAEIRAILPFKRGVSVQSPFDYYDTEDIDYFRNSWREYLISKNVSSEKRCGHLLHSCCLYDIDIKLEGKNITDYNRCMVINGNGIFGIWANEFGFEMGMINVLTNAKERKNYVPCKLYTDYPLDPLPPKNETKFTLFSHKKRNDTFASVFSKTVEDVRNSVIITRVFDYLKEVNEAKSYYKHIYPNDTLAMAAHREYIHDTFNSTWHPVIMEYNSKKNCTFCKRTSKVKLKAHTSYSKNIVNEIRKDVFNENNTIFINETYKRFNSLYDLDHWPSIQWLHMLYFSADNYEKSEVGAWLIGRKKYLVERGFVDIDHYEKTMKDRVYLPKGSIINLICARGIHLDFVCGDNTLRDPETFGPFLVINNLTTYFPPLPTTSHVMAKALNRSIELHALSADNYNFNRVYLNALSAVFNFILGLFIEISLDIWGGIVSIFTSLGTIDYQTFFFNTVGDYLIQISTCTWPLNVNGSTIYNPFCAVLIPEDVLDWIQLPPTSVLVVQIPWPQELISQNCTNIFNGIPFELTTGFNFAFSDNCGLDDQPRPYCPTFDYCQREYGVTCENLDFQDSLSSFFYLIGASSHIANTFINGGLSIKFIWFITMATATIISFVLVPYVAPFILFFISLGFWMIAVSFEVISFGFILLVFAIIIAIFAPGVAAALPLIASFVVMALVMWGVSVFAPYTPNYSIMPTLISIVTFINNSFLFFWVPSLDPVISRMNRFNYVNNNVPGIDTFCFFETFSNTGFMFLSGIGVGVAGVVLSRIALSTFIFVGELISLFILMIRSIKNDEAYEYDLQNKKEMKQMREAIKKLKKTLKEKDKDLKEGLTKLKDNLTKAKNKVRDKVGEVKIDIKDFVKRRGKRRVVEPMLAEMSINDNNFMEYEDKDN